MGNFGEDITKADVRRRLPRTPLVEQNNLPGEWGGRYQVDTKHYFKRRRHRRTLYLTGSKNERSFSLDPPPGPPWRKTTRRTVSG